MEDLIEEKILIRNAASIIQRYFRRFKFRRNYLQYKA